jgi:hypothetical protein
MHTSITAGESKIASLTDQVTSLTAELKALLARV